MYYAGPGFLVSDGLVDSLGPVLGLCDAVSEHVRLLIHLWLVSIIQMLFFPCSR